METVYMGTYPQNDPDMNESIEWLVLKKEEDRALLLSKYALDCQPYNPLMYSWNDVTWETCTLRVFLNDFFFDYAFMKSEKERIRTERLVNTDNGCCAGGNDTEDRIFLLSLDEVKEYIPDIDTAESIPTAHAKFNGAPTDLDGRSWAWLRSPGLSRGSAAGINYSGTLNYIGCPMDSPSAVRPAMWINI